MSPERLLVTGGSGLLGYALKEYLPQAVFISSKECDLRNREEVRRLFFSLRPDCVIHLAAEVGGVQKNAAHNADLFTSNVLINTNVLSLAQEAGVSRLISVLSNCAYSFYPDRPSSEGDLHVGMPFAGNLGYGYAKRMLDIQTHLLWKEYGARFSSMTPVTMYGPNDNWDLNGGHVVGSLIHKCLLAKEEGRVLEVWGSGQAVRQFVYAGDVARILIEALNSYHGTGTVIVAPRGVLTIRELSMEIAKACNFKGDIIFDQTKPEGEQRRVMESEFFSKQFPGFDFTPLDRGLKKTVEWFSKMSIS